MKKECYICARQKEPEKHYYLWEVTDPLSGDKFYICNWHLNAHGLWPQIRDRGLVVKEVTPE